MRGVAAKKIRRQVYGSDMSIRARDYGLVTSGGKSIGQIVNRGLRRAYQEAKKKFKEDRHAQVC